MTLKYESQLLEKQLHQWQGDTNGKVFFYSTLYFIQFTFHQQHTTDS